MAIRTALASRVGDSGDPTAIVQAALNMWHEVAVLLTPIVGAERVRGLFERAPNLTKNTFPCLATVKKDGGHKATLAGLEERLQTCKPETIATVSCALFVTFTELFAALIGEDLTERLLGSVWTPRAKRSAQEAARYSLLVAGPSGSGKTILATQLLVEGVRIGEPGVVVAFEQTPSQSWTRTIDDMAQAGKTGLITAMRFGNFRLRDKGIIIGEALGQYEGLLGGRPTRSLAPPPARSRRLQ